MFMKNRKNCLNKVLYGLVFALCGVGSMTGHVYAKEETYLPREEHYKTEKEMSVWTVSENDLSQDEYTEETKTDSGNSIADEETTKEDTQNQEEVAVTETEENNEKQPYEEGTEEIDSDKEGTNDNILEDAPPMIKVREIDLGDYLTEMTVGDKQLLSVTVIPTDSTEQECKYTSSDKSVASINGIGRIHAHSVGSTRITVSAGEINTSFMLNVTDKKKVLDIELADYEKELFVDQTTLLSATVLPAGVPDAEISYSSSNPLVASVSSQGEVKGISKGRAIIIVSAGGFRKEVTIDVKVSTANIVINEDYLILKPKESFQLVTEVLPEEAEQKLTYRVLDENIAEVTGNGLVVAKEEGNTSILVSNGETTMSVSVIVNVNAKGNSGRKRITQGNSSNIQYPNWVDVQEYSVISADMLYYLYSQKESLLINGRGYQMIIDGEQIKNHKNSIYTDIELVSGEDGIHFNLNRGRFLCGEVRIIIEEAEGEYLYLYNESKKKYEMLQTEKIEELVLTTPGEYLITKEKMDGDDLPVREMGVASCAIVVVLLGIYIGLKKKYWFW